MNLLITGPPASGKSRAAMEHFQSSSDRVLIVPTATMVDHVRHSLARSGFPVRPREIRTLANCLEDWSSDAFTPAALLDLLIEQCLDRQRPERFSPVMGVPGVRRALADMFEQTVPAALPEDLATLQKEIERNLKSRGLGLRHARLRSAAETVLGRITLPHIVIDGFFTFSAAETQLVVALAERTSVVVTLPDWAGSENVRNILLAAGFAEQRLVSGTRSPDRTGFSAATIEREVEEIARRILQSAERGAAFREMGIVLRSREPYAGIVETTLARFGIPARFYFQHPLSSHPISIYFSNLIRGVLAGLDHAMLLTAVRMPVSGLGATAEGDELDFAWRDKLPGFGLPLPAELDQLAALHGWSRERLEPREWAARLHTLRTLLPSPKVRDDADRNRIGVLRSTSAALAAFDDVLDGAATALAESGRCSLAAFWKQVETALDLEPLRVPDGRRNVVHVMDAYEARQWELPIVFVCGLIERHFPQYHREDAILGDVARRNAGLDTAADRQVEEDFLFELATSRATEQIILSYPRFDEQGEDTLPSFFLGGTFASIESRPIVPRLQANVNTPRTSGDLPLFVHKTLSPTGIESFLQCPFQFFASKTLRLRRRPSVPRDRLDLLLQGSMLHHALAEWTRVPLLGSAILDEIFEAECARLRVPGGYRTEAVRLELLRNFRGFLEDPQFTLRGWATRVEEKFSYALNPAVSITGRVDRLDVGPANQALVIDYKYSAGNKIRERVEDTSGGHLVQGGLYLAAAARTFGLDPVAMLFCGLRKDVTWDGWHIAIPGLESLGTSCTRDVIRNLIHDAETAAVRAHEAITSGDIAVRPRDPVKCRWCDFHDVCRVESRALAQIGHA